jgi:hypothetical protein
MVRKNGGSWGSPPKDTREPLSQQLPAVFKSGNKMKPTAKSTKASIFESGEGLD